MVSGNVDIPIEAIRRLEQQRLQKEKRVLEWFENPESGLLGEDWYKNNAKK